MLFLKLFWNPQERRLRALWRLGVHTSLVLIVIIALGFFLLLAGGLPDANFEDNPLTIVVSNLIFVVSIVVCARLIDRRSVEDIGMRINRTWWLDFAVGIFIGTLVQLFTFIALLSAGWLRVEPATLDTDMWLGIFVWFIAFLSVGFGEEMLARGYHLRNLAEGLNGLFSPVVALVVAALASSVIFGALHMANPNMTPMAATNLCLAGVVFAVSVLLTGRLGLAIGYHTSWNFMMSNVLGLPVSGITMETGALQTTPTGPEWITGGPFGPEGGVAGLAAELLSLLLIVLYVKAGEGPLRIAMSWTEYHPPGWRRLPEPPRIPTPLPQSGLYRDDQLPPES